MCSVFTSCRNPATSSCQRSKCDVTDVTPREPENGVRSGLVTASETPDTGYLPVMLNPFEPGFFADPYAQYRLVREQDPVHPSPIGPRASSRYADAHRIRRDQSPR